MKYCLGSNKNISIKWFLIFIWKKYYSLVAVFKIFNAVYDVSDKKKTLLWLTKVRTVLSNYKQVEKKTWE